MSQEILRIDPSIKKIKRASKTAQIMAGNPVTSPMKAYSGSKIANIDFTCELGRN